MTTATGLRVPYVDLPRQHAAIKAELMEAIASVIDSGQFVLGAQVAEFEQRFAELCGVRYAVGVNSGTDALILALRALGVGPGDEVITAPNSFVASATCIRMVGATPVFVDVRDDYNLDPALLESAITPRTKGILPVHLTGRPAPMGPIMDVARAHGLVVVEDCAQAVRAEYRGQRVGSFGEIGCFSLHPLKTLNAMGDGGMLTTDDPALHQALLELRNIGLRTRDECVAVSGNSRLDTLQAAVLLVKLRHLEEWTMGRRRNAAFYQQALAGLAEVQQPLDADGELAVYHTFVIQADRRDELKAFLASRGVDTAIHYPIPIHRQPAMADLPCARASYPNAERQADRILSLPVYPELETEQLAHVATTIREFYGHASY